MTYYINVYENNSLGYRWISKEHADIALESGYLPTALYRVVVRLK